VDLADYPTWRAALAHACAAVGDLDRAREIVHVLEAAPTPVSRYWLATAQLAIGDRHRALTSLEEAAESREWFLITMRYEPLFRSLRTEPRFIRLLSVVNDGAASRVG
jgi:hypothetical protein